MDYKLKDDIICCTRTDDGLITLVAPWSVNTPEDDTLEWFHTDKQIIRLDDFSFVFEDDPRVLGNVKQRKLAGLVAAFDEHVAGSFTTSQGYLMQFDTSDAIKMEGAIKLLETTGATEGYLTQADDTTVYHVPLDTMKAVLIEMMSAFAACHARKQELRAAINSAETVEELDAIKITWPL